MRWLRICLVMALFVLAACSDGGVTAPAGGMALAEITPAPGATGIDPASPIAIRFSGAMASGMEQYADLHRGDISGPVVPMGCAWSTDRSTLTCTPGEPLQSETRYTIHMGSGMTDANGRMADTEQYGMQMGGQPVTAAMLGPMHGGNPAGMLGPGWQDADHGHMGIAFTFKTR